MFSPLKFHLAFSLHANWVTSTVSQFAGGANLRSDAGHLMTEAVVVSNLPKCTQIPLRNDPITLGFPPLPECTKKHHTFGKFENLFFNVHPEPGGNDPIRPAYLSKWVGEKPPSS